MPFARLASGGATARLGLEEPDAPCRYLFPTVGSRHGCGSRARRGYRSMIYAGAEILFYGLAAACQRSRALGDLRRDPERAATHQRDRVLVRLPVRNGDRVRPRPALGQAAVDRLDSHETLKAALTLLLGLALLAVGFRARHAPPRTEARGVVRRRSSPGSAMSARPRRSPWLDSSASEGRSDSCSPSSPWLRRPGLVSRDIVDLILVAAYVVSPRCSSRCRSAS